jgi:cytochrome c2
MRAVSHLVAAVVLLAGAAACSQGAAPGAPVSRGEQPAPAPPPASAAATAADARAWVDVEHAAAGDAARGKMLVAHYECNRCHEGTGLAAPPLDRQCVGCHDLVAAGRVPVTPDRLQAMQKATRHYLVTPGLGEVGSTLRASWIARFLHEPVKVRTREEEWMPRLSIPEDDARDIAAYLTAKAPTPALDAAAASGDAERGKQLFARKACFMCHDFTGAPPAADVTPEMPAVEPERLARAATQAPDLRLARERVRPDVLVRWIQDPRSVRGDALMPALGVTPQEARDLAAYVLTTPLAAPPAAAAPLERLPLLERRVGYDEVAARVFRVSCVHCHADPGKGGDPGPGSAGGFGFAPRGVRLLSYEGARRSAGSRLVAALVARHEEVAGRPVEGVRGMPMGLPPLPPEQIQLVESWVAQGAPR